MTSFARRFPNLYTYSRHIAGVQGSAVRGELCGERGGQFLEELRRHGAGTWWVRYLTILCKLLDYFTLYVTLYVTYDPQKNS